MKYVIYLRVSTDKQDVEAQRMSCHEYIQRNGGGEFLEFCDEAVSGTLRMEDREQMVNAINSLQKGDIFLIARRDRLGRDVVHNAMAEMEIKKRKARLVTVAQNDSDMDAGMAQMMRTIVDAFAQYERYLISSRTKAKMAAKKQKNERVGRIPYGFCLSEDGIHLEPCPKEQGILSLLNHHRHLGLSYRDLEKYCEKYEIRNRQGGKFYHRDIWTVLKNLHQDYKSVDLIPILKESQKSLQCV